MCICLTEQIESSLLTALVHQHLQRHLVFGADLGALSLFNCAFVWGDAMTVIAQHASSLTALFVEEQCDWYEGPDIRL